MIVISAGMEKSGTAWFFNLTNDLMVAAGLDNVRTIRERYGLQDILLYHNCNIHSLTPDKMTRLLRPHNCGHSFAVKTHCGPTSTVMTLMNMGIVKATYIYRDPRDVLLSAMDHGEKLRRSGQDHTFARFDSLEHSVEYMKEWLHIWEQWTRLDNVFSVRYEELIGDPSAVLRRLAGFLTLEISPRRLDIILAAYDRKNLNDDKADVLHFNKGVAERYRHTMTPEQQQFCREQFGDYLEKMGCAC